MKSIKFVQWQSSILVGAIVIAGFFCLFLEMIEGWVKFATVAAIFVGPEVAAAFFGPALKRKQNGEQGG